MIVQFHTGRIRHTGYGYSPALFEILGASFGSTFTYRYFGGELRDYVSGAADTGASGT